MIKTKGHIILGVMAALFAIQACNSNNAYKEDALLQLAQSYLKPIVPINDSSVIDVSLGKRLFLDANLSVNRDISCNSCHSLKDYGVDGLVFSKGTNEFLGVRNTPSVYNASLQFAQMWDGSAADLKEQALGPLFNGHEMALEDEDMLVERIRESYPDLDDIGATAIPEMVYQALSDFQSTLITPSRFDDYLNGDISALNQEEKKGLKLFIESGCTPCHGGVTVGGQLIQPFPLNGIVSDYLQDSTSSTLKLKVPSLRNVDKTAPYFHDGSISELNDAVDIMARSQTNSKLSESEIDLIVIFLQSLIGQLDL
jgi:cytochrome c peroxidase